MAHGILHGKSAPDWSKRPSEFEQLVAPSTAASSQALMLRMTSAEDRTYGLAVVNGKVTTLHTLTEPPEIRPEGGKFVWLSGDVRTVSGYQHFPPLVELPDVNSRQASARQFTTKSVAIKDWAAIAAELNGENQPELAEAGTAPAVHVHGILHVPPVLAAFFLTPLAPNLAFKLGGSLRGLIGDGHRENYDPFFEFLCAAVTRHNTANRSAMLSNWARFIPEEDTPMEARYHRMVSKLIPPVAPRPVTLPSRPEPDERPAGGGSGKDKHDYADFQMRRLWSAAGKDSNTFAVQTEASLPDLFQGLKEHRGSSTTARHYIESQWKLYKSTEPFPTPFRWSQRLVNDIRHLNFGGQDELGNWEDRGKGLSYFVLGPLEVFDTGRHVKDAEDWDNYEKAEQDGTLTLAERKEASKGATLVCSVPDDKMKTLLHLHAVAARYIFLFGEQCPVVDYLRWFAQQLMGRKNNVSWEPGNWKAFNWRVHMALRLVWNDCENGIGKDQLRELMAIKDRVNGGERYHLMDCPAELQGQRKRDANGNPKGSGGSSGSSGNAKSGDSDKQKATPKRSPIAENFDKILRDCKAACKDKRNFHIGKVLPKAEDFEYVMGNAFMVLSEGGPACGKFYLARCTAKKCKYHHELKEDPTKAVIEGMVKRFQEKADAYIAAEVAKN